MGASSSSLAWATDGFVISSWYTSIAKDTLSSSVSIEGILKEFLALVLYTAHQLRVSLLLHG